MLRSWFGECDETFTDDALMITSPSLAGSTCESVAGALQHVLKRVSSMGSSSRTETKPHSENKEESV